MSDLRLGANLGTFATQKEAIEFAKKHGGHEALLLTPEGEVAVHKLEASGAMGDHLEKVAQSLFNRSSMTSRFVPECFAFVMDDPVEHESRVVDNHDWATLVRRQRETVEFVKKPVSQKVDLWQQYLSFAEKFGGIGPNELATIRELAYAIRKSAGPQDAAAVARLNDLEKKLVSECEAADLATLTQVRERVLANDLRPGDFEAANEAILRSYGPEHSKLAAEIVEALPEEFVQKTPAATRFRLTAGEFVQPLKGSEIQNGRYADPTAMLTFGQRDLLAQTRQDSSRCGAASLVAAAVVLGPDALQKLADRFGVAVDVKRPTAGAMHLLMEQIYVQTRTAHAVAGEPPAVRGLTDGEIREIAKEVFGPISDTKEAQADQLKWDGVDVAFMAVGGTDGDHAILIYRDPKTGNMAKYEPEVILGQASTVFESPEAVNGYLKNHPTRSFPGKVYVTGTIGGK